MSLYDVLEDTLTRAQQKNPQGDVIIPGVMLGVVLENNNDNFPGMVKVEIINQDPKQNITDWMRVITPYGGDKWGRYILPEIGDQVLLAFLEGHKSRPFVIGSVYREKNEIVPKSYNKKNTIKSLKTKGGISVIFNDEDKKNKVILETQNQLTVELNDEAKKITVRDKNSQNKLLFEMDKNQITLEAKTKLIFKVGSSQIVVDAQSVSINTTTLNVNTKQKAQIKSAQVNINGSAQTAIKGGTMDISANGPLNIKGAIVKIN